MSRWQGVFAHYDAPKLPRVRSRIKAGGNGVPNQGPWQHRVGGSGVAGYTYRYHDQMVTGNSIVESPQINASDYLALRVAAAQGQSDFNTAIAASGWATFFSTYSGISMTEARLGVSDLQ